MAQKNAPTPKGEANKTATDAAAKDGTKGDKAPVPATQDSGGDGRDTAPTEGGTAQGPATGKLDLDHDGNAETPEGPSPKSPHRHPGRHRGMGDGTDSAKSFEDICEQIGKGVKKLTEAGLGAQAAGDLALRVYERHCC